jgi:CRISPR/Cas system CMR subunit Cmr6 (Cas7 group RAMP superfamily)
MASIKKNETKVDRAFAVVDRLEKNAKQVADSVESSESGKKRKRSGLQFRFSMDALISDQDTRSARENNLRSGESNLLNFKITLPHIWKIPVIGKTALKIIRRIQTEEYPESLKDILKSLKKKKL